MAGAKADYTHTIAVVHKYLEAGFKPPSIQCQRGETSALMEAAKEIGITHPSLRHRLDAAKIAGLHVDWSRYKPRVDASATTDSERLENEVRTLRASLAAQKREALTYEAVKKHILNLWESPATPPKWLAPKKANDHGPTGVPTLFCSDWHWGEVVKAHEIDGVNEFNIAVAQSRVQKLWAMTEQLLFHHIAKPRYDGIVVALGGDMVTGDIHEELSKTNDAPIMPTVLDLIETIIWLIEKAASKFENVYVPCVTGNHGRSTHKIQYKERGPTSYDWLAYRVVARHFKNNPRVTFEIPDGPDILYRVYSRRYLLTHGDQFRGGDGLIGPLGPITRGRHKKQSRNQALSRGFDTMICGHFHNLIQLPHLIVNGALKGYDEYAFGNNFTFERASQALWITHPQHGITFQMPIYVDEDQPGEKDAPWVSLPRAA